MKNAVARPSAELYFIKQRDNMNRVMFGAEPDGRWSIPGDQLTAFGAVNLFLTLGSTPIYALATRLDGWTRFQSKKKGR